VLRRRSEAIIKRLSIIHRSAIAAAQQNQATSCVQTAFTGTAPARRFPQRRLSAQHWTRQRHCRADELWHHVQPHVRPPQPVLPGTWNNGDLVRSTLRHASSPVKAVLRRKNRFMRAGRTAKLTRWLAVFAPSSLAAAPSGCAKLTPRKVLNMRGWKSVKSYEAQGETATDKSTAWQLKLWTTTTRPFLPTVDYRAPDSKHTARERANNFITEMEVFRILDALRPTATGLELYLPGSWGLEHQYSLRPSLSCSINPYLTASCLVNGRQLLSLRSPKFPSQLSSVTIDQYRLLRFSHVLSKGALLEGTCNVSSLATSAIWTQLWRSSDFGRPAQHSTAAAIIATLHTVYARCCRPTNTYEFSRLTSRRLSIRWGTWPWWENWRLWGYQTISTTVN